MRVEDLKVKSGTSLKIRFMIFLLQRKKFIVIMKNLKNALNVNLKDFAGDVLPYLTVLPGISTERTRNAGKN